MKKAFDQTVRELKREVNKKVLKVPGIEQKVLDATSNEPWGPHGSLLADIAQATKNYHEYQMIMAVVWKRINDTGKNWRHVYKALIILEYLVAHGSERVIDEIREHAYQISTLSDFQYIDSSGRDQGSNVRKKSQSLVVLVNDKDRIQEVRQKAAANRDKFRNTSRGGMYRPSSYSGTGGNSDRYDDDHYGSRDDDLNGYDRDREWGSRDDRYGKYGGDGDLYGRYGYKDGYRGRSRSIDDYQYGLRSRSSDRDRGSAYEDDGQYSSRGSGARADDHSQEGSSSGKQLDQKFCEQNLGGPPSYEDAVGEARSPGHSERGGETSAFAPKTSASLSSIPSQANSAPGMVAAPASPPPPPPAAADKEVGGIDEFDPRGSFSVTFNGAEIDLLGSLSDTFSNPLAIMPVASGTTTIDVNASANYSSGPTFHATPSASSVTNQPFGDPFGDGPFKAFPTADGALSQPQNIRPTSSFDPMIIQRPELTRPIPDTVDNTVKYGDVFPGMAFTHSINTQFLAPEFPTSNRDTDILDDIVPLSGPPPPVASQTVFPAQGRQPPTHTGIPVQTSYHTPRTGFPAPSTHTVQPAPTMTSKPHLALTGPLAVVQPSKDKFDPKFGVWADTLSRGLVNLNISGPKINPLADIGVDFDAINRKDKRMEKPTTMPVTSTVNMGKAMGSGSGMGRAGASFLRPPSTPMGVGGYGGNGMNQPMGMAQGHHMQPTGSTMPGGGYNPIMGRGGGYVPQQPYSGGGY